MQASVGVSPSSAVAVMLGDVAAISKNMTCSDQLIRRFIAGDAMATGVLVERAGTSDEPAVLVAAALVVAGWAELLARAAETAQSGRDRRLVVIAAAHLRGDADRALLLARDHLADHPDSLLVAHIAATCTDSRETRNHP